jgi:hypothetical protein
MVRSLPTTNRLEKRLDRPQSTTRYPQNPRRDESTIPTMTNQQNKSYVPRNHIHLQVGRGAYAYIQKPEHPLSVLHVLKGLL